MMHRFFYLIIFSFSIAWGFAKLDAAEPQPNFVIILADDIGWDAFGCTGSAHARTPHIDQLAGESIVMDRLYCSVSQCAPLRAEFYTGLLPYHNGVRANATKEKREGVLNVADHLKPLGYRVGLTGKRHFGLGMEKIDTIEGFPAGANDDIAEYDLGGVRAYIEAAEASSSPFCVFVCSVHAHHPWTVGDATRFPREELELPPHYADTPSTREALAIHAAEVEQFDQQVGDTRALIQELGLEKDTILIVLSEQGIAMPRGKWSPYEHGSRALSIVHWPERFTPRRTSAIAMYCDFVPTLIDFAGGGVQADLDGVSLKPLWSGQSDKHRESAFISNVHPFWQKAIVTEQYKLIWSGFPETDHIWKNFNSEGKFFAQSWGEWIELAGSDETTASKVQHVLRPKTFELYDVQEDPYEVKDLLGNPEYEYVKEKLLVDLKELMKEAGEPLEPERKGK